MATSKYNITRIKHLWAMLKENRYPNFPRFLNEMKKNDIAGTYKLSARTLQRDIAFLKSEYNAPICYDYERKGYYLTRSGGSVDIPFLDDNDMQAAVIGARLAENIMPSPVKQDVRNAVDSLLAVNNIGMDEKSTLLSLIAIGSRVSVKAEVFRPIFDAWQTHQCVKLIYEQVEGDISERIIEPHALVFYEGNWYIKAITCSQNGVSIPRGERSVKTLALHRIHSAENTAGVFEPDQKIIDKVNRREIFNFPLVKDIRLRLGQQALKFVGEQFEIAEEGRDGEFFLVRVKEAAEYKIVNYVLAEGGDAKLLSHPEIAAEVIKRAKMVIAVQEET
ncbi:MAG: WYL domain-containing protein [Victivallales bacterium]|jgi:predicted DNA-binding transcriptional regulator YafY|nr:WYL domain-containing protein [Victivallales bacterium]